MSINIVLLGSKSNVYNFYSHFPSILLWCQVLYIYLFRFFFLLSFFLNFNWRLIILQYCGGFWHTLIRISYGCTCVPHPDSPSHLPPHSIPQGHPSAPVLSTLPHALNLDWQSDSQMIIYMFQCYSLKSSHPHLSQYNSLSFTSGSLLLSCI